ncbi:MAG: hypothetical protein ACYCSP_06020 [Acidobacteriaceae bacterium]
MSDGADPSTQAQLDAEKTRHAIRWRRKLAQALLQHEWGERGIVPAQQP